MTITRLNAAARKPRFIEDQNDPHYVPPFLRITPEAEKRRQQAWIDKPPKPFELINRSTRTTNPEAERVAAELEAERKAKAEHRKAVKISRTKNVLPDDLTGYRWSTTRSRWERDSFISDELLAKMKAERAAKSGLVYNDKVVPTAKAERVDAPKAARPKNADDLGAQVSAHCGTDVKKIKSFAKANGCWDDKYDKLPNAGLVRMNVVNRLRAKVRKGHKVEWK